MNLFYRRRSMHDKRLKGSKSVIFKKMTIHQISELEVTFSIGLEMEK